MGKIYKLPPEILGCWRNKNYGRGIIISWSNYKKIDPPYELNFRNGIDPKTGVKQGWLLQSMKTITLEEKNNIKQLIGV